MAGLNFYTDILKTQNLTRMQKKTLKAIEQFIIKHKYSPSQRELSDMLGLVGTKTVSIHLHHLRDKGYISFVDGQNRTIVVLEKV